MSVEQLTYNALVSAFQGGFLYVVPAALVACFIYRVRV